MKNFKRTSKIKTHSAENTSAYTYKFMEEKKDGKNGISFVGTLISAFLASILQQVDTQIICWRSKNLFMGPVAHLHLRLSNGQYTMRSLDSSLMISKLAI